MSKFIVIALSMAGLGNKIYESGDVVTADCFATPVQELIDGGWLAPANDTVVELTQKDFDDNPDLGNQGLNVGDEVVIPEASIVPKEEANPEAETPKDVVDNASVDTPKEDTENASAADGAETVNPLDAVKGAKKTSK